MSGILKILLGIAGVLVAAALAIVAAVVLLVDPNEYRDTLAGAVEQATGRPLRIAGDLGLEFLPCCSVTVADASLGSPAGFEDERFLHARSAALSVRLAPLITDRRVEIGHVAIDGLALNLVTDAQGRNNWTFDRAGDESDSDSSEQRPTAFQLEGVELGDSSVIYRDAGSGERYEFNEVTLETGAIDGGLPVPLAGSTTVILIEQEVKAAVQFQGAVRFATDDGAFEITDLATDVQLTGLGNESYTADFKVVAPASTVTMQGKAEIPTLTLDGSFTSDDMTAAGQLSAVPLRISGSDVEIPVLTFDGQFASGALNAAGTARATPLRVSDGDVEIPVLTLDGRYSSGDLKVFGDLRSGLVRIADGGQSISVESLDTNLSAELPQLPGGATKGRVTVTRVATRDAGTNLALDGLDVDLQSGGARALFKGGGQIGPDSALTGRLDVPAFSPRSLIAAMGGDAPVTTDPDVLKQMSLDGALSVGQDAIGIEELNVTLDQTSAKGFFRIASIERQSIRFDLVGDALDFDRYLAPVDDTAGQTADETPVDNIRLPVDDLRALRMGGRLKLRSARMDGMDLENLVVNIVAQNGNIRVQPLKASLYSGGFDGGVYIDVTGDVPAVRIEQALEGVAIGDLLAARETLENLTGTLGVTLTANATGHTVGELKRSLAGEVGFQMDDGVYQGVDVWHELRTQYARLRRRSPPEGPGAGETRIDELRGRGVFQGGALVSDDLVARIPFIVATGNGRVDLFAGRIDYRLSALVETTPEFEDGQRLDDLTGLRLPINIAGPMDDPRVSVDLAEVLKDVAVRELKEKVTDRLFDRLRKRLGEPEDKAPPDTDAGDQSL